MSYYCPTHNWTDVCQPCPFCMMTGTTTTNYGVPVSGRDEGKELAEQIVMRIFDFRNVIGSAMERMKEAAIADILPLISAAQTRACVEQREADAQLVESGRIDVVLRYTPFPHNKELTTDPLPMLADAIRKSALALSGTTLEQLLSEERATAYERCADEMTNDLPWSDNQKRMRQWATEARTATGGGGE